MPIDKGLLQDEALVSWEAWDRGQIFKNYTVSTIFKCIYAIKITIQHELLVSCHICVIYVVIQHRIQSDRYSQFYDGLECFGFHCSQCATQKTPNIFRASGLPRLTNSFSSLSGYDLPVMASTSPAVTSNKLVSEALTTMPSTGFTTVVSPSCILVFCRWLLRMRFCLCQWGLLSRFGPVSPRKRCCHRRIALHKFGQPLAWLPCD